MQSDTKYQLRVVLVENSPGLDDSSRMGTNVRELADPERSCGTSCAYARRSTRRGTGV